MRPHRRQPTRLSHPWDSPGKNTGVGCHFLLQCMKVKSESEVAQSCPTLSDPMDCSLIGSSVYGIFQARVLEWGAIAFSAFGTYLYWKNNELFNWYSELTRHGVFFLIYGRTVSGEQNNSPKLYNQLAIYSRFLLYIIFIMDVNILRNINVQNCSKQMYLIKYKIKASFSPPLPILPLYS